MTALATRAVGHRASAPPARAGILRRCGGIRCVGPCPHEDEGTVRRSVLARLARFRFLRVSTRFCAHRANLWTRS
jgi:hypothetical protein